MATRTLLIIVLLLGLQLSLSAQDQTLIQVEKEYNNFSFLPATGFVWPFGNSRLHRHTTKDEEDKCPKRKEKWYNKEEYTAAKRMDLYLDFANAYFFNADYKRALCFYRYAEVELDTLGNNRDSLISKFDLRYYFRYALSLRSMGEYLTSEYKFREFNELAKSLGVDTLKYKPNADFEKEIARDSGLFKVEIASFNAPCENIYNSNCSDFAPSFYNVGEKEGIVISSNRNAGLFKRYRHSWNLQNLHDLFLVSEDSLEEVKNLAEINGIGHESSSAVSTINGIKYMFFTRNNITEEQASILRKDKFDEDYIKYTRLKIFISKWDGKKWGEPKSLPFNNENYSVAHPAVSPDGKTLYFASDMPGTFGESDIYKVSIDSIEGRVFGIPKNLGSNINSAARETFPFVSHDNILYFSSDWHQGLGGLDIFATDIEGEIYSNTVKNLGKPINSPNDDFSFIINEMNEGYFASNRPSPIIYSNKKKKNKKKKNKEKKNKEKNKKNDRNVGSTYIDNIWKFQKSEDSDRRITSRSGTSSN